MNENLENIIEKKCCYCENAAPIRETNCYICKKKGIVGYSFKCRKFTFDPIKLSPVLPARALQFTADDFKVMVEKFKALIEANGTINELEEMGKRKLAYLINDKSEGYYVLVKFTSGPEFPAELDRVLKITDGIMRSLLTVIGE